ncbi:MAG: hypothetical protein UW75_C0059G0003 [Parcubacteria group bacterium GW2011_GWF2_44_8]|nr:MAG: hypothetical protein UW75_C0059G0003 [Parcubacteria group bacterium GW2011_GWF2_44_8]
MTTVILLEVLYSVLIIACVFLIAVLWRTYGILSDLKNVSSIMERRAKEIDLTIGQAKESFIGLSEAIKAFIYSLGIVKKIRSAINNNDNKNKGE